ncbi:hypothetical protein H9P43_009274 [Blastocladiella emersonii ATCC 22665]|nr:hypothetical protein H9P43_009274 [Blastocladiella emersonii ATCC 22665]
MQPALVGFVARLLARYADASEWDRAFAPLDHVDARIWADLMATPTRAEFMAAAEVPVARGDKTVLVLVNGSEEHLQNVLDFLGLCLRQCGIPPLDTTEDVFIFWNPGRGPASLLRTVMHLFIKILANRVHAVLDRHDVLHGAKQLAAARRRSKVADDVLHIVAARSCAPVKSGKALVNGIWGHFMNQAQLQCKVPHDLFLRAMDRVKLPPEFVEFLLIGLLPEFDPNAARDRIGIRALADEVVAARGQV